MQVYNSQRIRVAWICFFSTQELRNRILIEIPIIERLIRRLKGIPSKINTGDAGIWNANAVFEAESIKDIDVHVIIPYPYLKSKRMDFEMRNIHYHCFRDETTSPLVFLKKHLIKGYRCSYDKNSNKIAQIVDEINPAIVHIMGAENPQYSLSALKIPCKYPIIVQLQTLLNEPKFATDFFKDERTWRYFADLENQVLQRADYIATRANEYQDFIKCRLKPDAKLLNTTLALAEPINRTVEKKEYDVVFFAKNINKGFDLALDAFICASKRQQGLTMEVIGGYSEDIKVRFDNILKSNNLTESVFFKGLLPTHDDVISHIRKAHVALLPIKVDLISGTIREAMSNGIPVVTTNTGIKGTQVLNKEKECVLISDIGDSATMANNMLRLLKDKNLYSVIVQNAYERIVNSKPNKERVLEWIHAYRTILNMYNYE